MRAWAKVLFVLAAAGCGAVPGELSHEYGKTVRKVGLFPVYPPREEFQIGDVYLWSMSNNDPNDTISVYIASMDWLRAEADKFMSTRVIFENTIRSEKDKPPARTDKDIPKSAGRASLGSRLVTRRELGENDLVKSLPIAAIPRITADAGFTASFGIVRALTALGLAGGARTQVDLNFNDVRTYWVPNVLVADEAERELGEIYLSTLMDAGSRELERMTAAKLGDRVSPCDGPRKCGLSVVTRVYLTRQIDYTYRNARIIAGALQSAERGFRRADVPAAPAVAVNVGNTQTGAIDSTAIDTARADIRKELDQLTASEKQGASLRFESWDARGMTFSSQYQRPVVVGWDGLTRDF